MNFWYTSRAELLCNYGHASLSAAALVDLIQRTMQQESSKEIAHGLLLQFLLSPSSFLPWNSPLIHAHTAFSFPPLFIVLQLQPLKLDNTMGDKGGGQCATACLVRPR